MRNAGVKVWLLQCPKDGTLPTKASAANLFDTLWKIGKWINTILDKTESSVNKCNMEALFLQMFDAKFICVKKGQ